MPESYWECSRCGALNKPFAALCFTCGGGTRRAAPAPRPRLERVHLTRGARALVAAALVLSALVGFVLVRTFRAPILENETAPEQSADAGREPVPPGATMPGAPDSGWTAPAPGDTPPLPGPPDDVIVRTPARLAEPRPRTFNVSDPGAYLAARGAAAARDPVYVLALRQRRVDDLRRRLAEARSGDERAKLQAWLDGALADLEQARR
jgi:hypothetical protein